MAAAVAHTSSSSVTRSPVSTADATTSVGARSSFCASFSPATRFNSASAAGPSTRKRQGWLRWCVGASRATASRSSRVSRGERLRPEGLVRPARRGQLCELHPRRALTETLAPARLRNAEKGQASSASASAAWSAASSMPSTCDDELDPRADDLVALALDLVHLDRDRGVEPARRSACAGQHAGEGHRDAAAVRGGEQLLGARLAVGVADPRREGEGQLRERAGLGRRACPRRARGSRPSRRVPCARCAASADRRHDGRGAVGVVGLGRRARRAEDAEHAHLAGAVVLEAVDEPGR